jgi:pyrroline-5-carboxylate reductase
LRRRVTSPGGTTEAALQILIKKDLAGIFKQALVGRLPPVQRIVRRKIEFWAVRKEMKP